MKIIVVPILLLAFVLTGMDKEEAYGLSNQAVDSIRSNPAYASSLFEKAETYFSTASISYEKVDHYYWKALLYAC